MICAFCGLQLFGGELCPHHVAGAGDRWAETNRIMCALFHRGVEPMRLPDGERFDTNIPSTPADQNVTPFVYTGGYE